MKVNPVNEILILKGGASMDILEKIQKYNNMLHEAEEFKLSILMDIESTGTDALAWVKAVTDTKRFAMYLDEDKASKLL